jgi:two-component system sensor histidine kinase UhpB
MAADTGGGAHELLTLQARYRELLDRLEHSQRDFYRLARSVFRVQEEERRRLSRDLHDAIGQNLTALKHQLALISEALLPEQEDSRVRLQRCVAMCAQTLEEARRLSRLLRPQVLDDLGLKAALQSLARTLGESGRLEIELELGALPDLDDDLQTLIFRIAQEALTNVVRHAGANRALVRLTQHTGWLHLTVWDDGAGCDPETAQTSGGSGLGGMRERLQLFGGRFELHSQPGQGCRIRALLPLDAATPGMRD